MTSTTHRRRSATRSTAAAPGRCGRRPSRSTSSPSSTAPRSASPGSRPPSASASAAPQLSTFTILQVFVYAAMQLPVGALLDRYGSKRMLGVGLTLLTAAQFGFAFVHSFPPALLCRVLLGHGRRHGLHLGAAPRRAVVLAAPHADGDAADRRARAARRARRGRSARGRAPRTSGGRRRMPSPPPFGVLTGVALVLVVKDSPYVDHHRDELRLRAIARTLRAAWLVPGTRLGLWSHFTSQFAANMFTMLWGFPFLVCRPGPLAVDGQRHAHASWSSRRSCRARSSAR